MKQNVEYTRQYLDLIEEVAEDGELTFKEIYRLAKWLNDNKEGRKSWPANQFYLLLKDVFADGKIDKDEARQVARLIQKVRREWAREHTLSGANSVDSFTVNSLSGFDDSIPLLPAIEYTTTIASFNAPDLVYEVDLRGPTCSCPDFKGDRERLPSNHISRCCKHIMRGFAEVRPAKGWPSWLDPFLEAGFRPMPDQKWNTCRVGNHNYLVSSAHPEWGNVYAGIDGESLKYGYSIFDERWSYGKEPEDPATLAYAVYTLSTK